MPSSWLNKILSHEVAPPEQAWVNITNELDKAEAAGNDLKEKMLAYEATPPTEALSNIFGALDEEEAIAQPAYIKKIQQYTATAPAAAWGNIAATLDKESAKVVDFTTPVRMHKYRYLKIAAAAAAIAIIVLLVVPGNNKHNTESTAAAPIVQPANQQAGTGITNSNPAIAKKDIDKKVVADKTNATNTVTVATANNQAQPYVKGNDVADLAANPAENNSEKLQNSKGEIPMDMALLNTPNTYISVMGADGQSVKVSSKFSNLIAYLLQDGTGTKENIDIIIEENSKWRAIISAWRDKMINNPITPTFSNFMDIIELSKILEDKN